MDDMRLALGEVPVGDPARKALSEFFEHSSAYIADLKTSTALNPEIGHRWETQVAIDETVAAIRAGDENFVIPPLANRQSIVGLLTLLIARRSERVAQELSKDPTLAQERYAGRTLLHEAAAHGNLPIAKLLLDLGVSPNTLTAGSHTPLCCVANECGFLEGPDIVRLLVEHGADVNASDGVKRCTPLHMAARRGFREIAEALLECGAGIEARDSLGETPLRRAVNCNKVGMAALLLAKGADRNSKGSKHLTPVLAARTPAMRQLFA